VHQDCEVSYPITIDQSEEQAVKGDDPKWRPGVKVKVGIWGVFGTAVE
jgi:hypothetical protein